MRQIIIICLVLLTAIAPIFAQGDNPPACVTDYDPETDYFPNKVEAVYATDWQVQYENNYKVVIVGPVGDEAAGSEERFILLQCGTPAPELTGELTGAHIIEIPVETIFETSGGGSVVTALEVLGEADALIGLGYIPPGNFGLYLPEVAAWFEDEEFLVTSISEGGWETVLAAQPDLIAEPYSADQRAAARELGLGAIFYNSYWETPLGGAEHIKFWSMLFNKEATANALFTQVEQDYLALATLVEAEVSTDERPTVLHGNINANNVFSTYGEGRIDYGLIEDAGGTPILLNTPEIELTAFTSLPIETVITIAEDADFWWNSLYNADQQFDPPTYEAVVAHNTFNASFSALAEGHMFHVFRRGEDFYKTALNYRADLVLKDLVSILHPELVPDHEPLWLQPITGQ